MNNVITSTNIAAANEILRKYKAAKANTESRLIENEEWWRLRHTDPDKKTPSGWLFNSIINKHADAMDNLPTCACLPREERDIESAKLLDKILPCIFEETGFEKVYSDVWYDKLKSGTGCYGVFWNPTLDYGLGNVDVRAIDVINLFWEPGISDIQESDNLFHIELWNNDEICGKYPHCADYISSPSIDTARYLYDDTVDTSDRSVVVDWYYKKKCGTRTVVHYCKFVGNVLLYASENDPVYNDKGYYDHGKYPFVFDKLYPIKSSPCGFGLIDAMKGTQNEIDSLGSSITKNARMAAQRRFFVRADGALNEKEFADWEKPFVHYSGSGDPTASIMPINVPTLPSVYLAILNNKIDELKETSGNRDFSQGTVTGGVTAASAIAALQEAGNKTTRDIISSTYRAIEEIGRMIIEIIRQFYTIPRSYRITGGDGIDFTSIMADMLTAPTYDIKVYAHKKNEFSRAVSNELACRLYELGLFNPHNSESAEICLKMMEFEGKDEIISTLKEHARRGY